MKKLVSIKFVLILGLSVLSCLHLIMFIILGSAPMYDLTTLIIILSYGLGLSLLTWKAKDDFLPFIGVLSYFFMVFIFSRTLSFLCLDKYVSVMFSFKLTAHQMNQGLIYIGLGTVAIVAGHLIALRLFTKFQPNFVKPSFPKVEGSDIAILGMFLCVCMAQCYIAIGLGNSVLGDLYYGVTHKFVGVLAVLFNTDMAFLASLIGFFALQSRKRKIKTSIIILSFVYTCILAILGSRQGGVAIMQHMLVCMTLILGNFYETIKNYLIYFIAIVVITVISFPVGTAIRTAMLTSQDIKMLQENGGGVNGIPSEVIGSGVWTKYIHFSPAKMLNRMNVVDAVALTLALTPNKELKDKYLNVSYGLKSAINSMVPGTVFDNADITTALVWPFVYEKRNIDLLYQKNYYESFYWTAWGLADILFGFTFGLVFLFFSGMVFQLSYFLILKIFNSTGYYFCGWLLYNVFAFYGNMGVDHWLVVFQKSFVTMSVALSIKWVIAKIIIAFKKCILM